MLARQSLPRATRALRPRTVPQLSRTYQSIRFQSTTGSTPSPSKATNGHFNAALTGGLVGGSATLLLGYAYYRSSGLATVVDTAKQTKQKFEATTQQLREKAPEPNEALKWLRATATSYASFIPGARGYVDAIFNDLEAIQRKHGPEVDAIVKDAYDELKQVTDKKGVLSIDTMYQAWGVLETAIRKIGDLAGDAASDILDNHPDIKEKIGGNLDQLKELGDKYGPEAKKMVDETSDQVRDILKSGVSVETVYKIRQLVQDKTEKIKKLGDEAWKKGTEQLKPYLDKNPEVKKIVEDNAQSFKQGNVKELYEKVKSAVESGNTKDLQEYVSKAAEKAKSSGLSLGGGLDKYVKMIPGGDEILPKLSEMQDIAEKHGDDAKRIAKETWEEIQEVVLKKFDEAKELKEKAEKEGGGSGKGGFWGKKK